MRQIAVMLLAAGLAACHGSSPVEGSASGPAKACQRSSWIAGTTDCLAGKAVQYELDTDVPLTLTLSDGRVRELPVGSSNGVF